MQDGLVYIGKIIQLDAIPDAQFIRSAVVVCGSGGRWRGVVRKEDFEVDDRCIVYLPDSVIPESEEMGFMKKRGWRVKMCMMRGAPSEVLIMKCPGNVQLPVGFDMTAYYGVTKYIKPIPVNLNGTVLGEFPNFMPKTDEPNYQSHPDLVDSLRGKPYYITEKVDGSSTTAYKYLGKFGVCGRNLEYVEDETNGYWTVANKYKLRERLPEGIALQWETCGPKVQTNSMELKEVDGFAFSAYDIENRKYLEFFELRELCNRIGFPMTRVLECGEAFNPNGVEMIGNGLYVSGREREGVVVRSQYNMPKGKPISFKVINLKYET